VIIKSQKDFFSGLLYACVGGAFAIGATGYKIGTSARMGPGFFPLLLGVILALIGLYIMFKAMVVKTPDGDKIGSWAWKPLVFIIAGNLLFGILLGGLPSWGVPAMGLVVARQPFPGLRRSVHAAESALRFHRLFAGHADRRAARHWSAGHHRHAAARDLRPAALAALIMLAGIYYGAQYGGSTTAILVNLPGESSSVVTVIDGYQMARKGRAGPALAAAGIGSFFAGSVGTLILAAFAAPLTELALKFGPAEYFSLMVVGLIGAVVLASGSLLKALAMIVLGLLLGLVGTDVNSGVARYSFDIPELTDGISFLAIAMGVFGYGEIISNLSKSDEERQVFTGKVSGIMPTLQDFKRMAPAMLRGTAMGSALGILPGGGALLAAFTAYTVEKKTKLNPGEVPFGQGNIRGVAAPESANNAGAQTSFIPLLTLGIPPNAVMALMVGAMTIHNIQPGPQVMTSNPELFWGLIASMWIGNAMLVILNLPLIGIWIKLLTVPYKWLFPAIVSVLCGGRLLGQQQQLRHLDGGLVRFDRLRLHQAGLRACAAAAGLDPGPHDGRVPAPRACSFLAATGPSL
jgi:TctA family transporter